MNKVELGYILKWSKKLKSNELLGNRCYICGESNFIKFDFHHINGKIDKEENISKMNSNKRWSIIENELKKCQLLCKNCHKEIHDKIDSEKRTDPRFINNKKIFLEFKGTIECQKCGYSKCNAALDFHHLGNKKFILSRVMKRIKNISELTEEIISELNKCIVLCKNCHSEETFDLEKFNKYKDFVYEKINTYKEHQKVSLDDILILKNKGLTHAEISRELGIAKSSVTYSLNSIK